MIRVIESPRGSGKTSSLMLEALKTYNCSSQSYTVYYVTFTENERGRIENEFKQINESSDIKVVNGNAPMFNKILSNRNLQKIIFFVDEPFLLYRDVQSALIAACEEFNLDIMAKGTRQERSKTFEDFL